MPKFLSRSEVYNLIQRLLPEDVYVTTKRPEEFVTTSEDDATAEVIGSAYGNLERIYDNYFPQTTDEFIDKWEVKVFGELMDSVSGLEFRRDRVLTKLRSRKGIRPFDIKQIVQLVIGSDKEFEIIEFGCGNGGAWQLDVSQLGVNTYLHYGFGAELYANDPDLCQYLPGGTIEDLTADEVQEWLFTQYTYKIKILNYMATDAELAEIDRLLTINEPARSNHIIENGAVLTEATVEWLLGFSQLGFGTFLT